MQIQPARASRLLQLLAGAGFFAATSMPALASSSVDIRNATMRLPRAGFTSTVISLVARAENGGRIVGASSVVAGTLSLLTMRRDGVEVTMERAPPLVLPAGREVQLRTGVGETFLMAGKIKRQLYAGEKIPLELRVENDRGQVQVVKVKATVVAPKSHNTVPEDHQH